MAMLLDAVRRTIERQALFAPGSRILVGLSGGADSVALLLLLRELERDGALTVAGAAHLHHQLRGAEADADEAFCAELAARLGVPFRAERVDVAARARAEKRSIEEAARRARYEFFGRVAGDLPADVVAVAHTKEDQAETFLLRLLRGSGTRGLAGIRPRLRLPAVAPEPEGWRLPAVVPDAEGSLPAVAPEARRWVVRPLLDIARADLRAYLALRGQAFREDSSNADVAIPRNRLRHEVIPYLQSHFSPGITDVLARDAALARQDEDFLRAEAIKLADRIVLSDVAVRIDALGLSRASRALSSRVVQMALEHHAGSKPISFDHVEQVLALAPGQAVSLPGQDAVRVGDRITLRPRSGRGPAAPKSRGGRTTAKADEGGPAHHSSRGGGSGDASEGGTDFAFSLSIPGEVELGPQRMAVGAEMAACRAEAEREGGWAGRGSVVGVASGALALPLAVRSRRPGDRFRPLGAPGGRKLQDFLVDRKVPRHDRDSLPLVVDQRDRIVWVVGQAVAEDFRVTDPSQGVLLLKVRRF